MIDEAKLSKLVEDAVRRVLEAAPQGEERYLSVARAADYAEVAAPTIREWIHDGRLGTYHAGRELRVKKSELDALLAGKPLAKKLAETPELAAERKMLKRVG